MQIKVEHLNFIYSEKSKALSIRALNDISLTINDGDFFGIIGHTGSGKSTFVQHLNGLIKTSADKGKLFVGDYDLTDKKCNYRELRSKVGMVFQYPEYQLFAETVFQDVAFGLSNFCPNLDQTEVENRVRRAIEIVGLNYFEIKDKSPFELSGGQKRRVAIAGVLVTKPEVLVLDEPAAGLDPVGKRDFIELLHKLKGEFVRTIIIVSHDMNLISDNCNRAVIFNQGKIYKIGSPKEIFSDGESLKEIGLELPVVASLTEKLKANGIEIDSDFSEQGFIEKLANKFVGGKSL